MQDINKTRSNSVFSKSWEIKKTNKQQLDLCDYTELHRVCTYCILHIPVESHKKFFEHTTNDPVLEGTACKEKDSLTSEWIFMYIIWIESTFKKLRFFAQ